MPRFFLLSLSKGEDRVRVDSNISPIPHLNPLPSRRRGGFRTQDAIDKWLRKNEGVTRHDLGREKFLRRVLEWQDKHGGIIIQQLKRLGCSCDWSRQRYTMDQAYARAVEKIFVDLYKKK